MTDEQSKDGKATGDERAPPASTRTFDRSRVHAERQVATLRLLARLKAIDSTLDVQTARAYASRYIREQEPLIRRLLDAGVGVEEVLADLAISFPSIPKSDLRYAIAQLRDRRRKQTGTAAAARAKALATEPQSVRGESAQARASVNPVAEPLPQRPDESDEDYRLRQSLEGPADMRAQFIGEQ